MAYDKTKYGQWRTLKLSHKEALALAADDAPKMGAKMPAIADLGASPTAAQVGTKVNDLLAALRTAGYLSS